MQLRAIQIATEVIGKISQFKEEEASHCLRKGNVNIFCEYLRDIACMNFQNKKHQGMRNRHPHTAPAVLNHRSGKTRIEQRKHSSFCHAGALQCTLLLLSIFGCSALIQGCATNQQPAYTIHYCNLESTPVSGIRVDYGGTTWPVPRLAPNGRDASGKCKGGFRLNAIASMPENMKLTWTINSHRKEAVVPIKSKLNGIHPTSTIQVNFRGDDVEVFEYAAPIGAEELNFRIYPDLKTRHGLKNSLH